MILYERWEAHSSYLLDLLHLYTLGKAIENVDWNNIIETIEYNGNTYKAYPTFLFLRRYYLK